MDWARVYYLLSERFGWLPDEISHISIEQISDYLNEIKKVDEAKSRAMKSKKR